MKDKLKAKHQDPEIEALKATCAALKNLDDAARARVLNYVKLKFQVGSSTLGKEAVNRGNDDESRPVEQELPAPPEEEIKTASKDDDVWSGVSPAAMKWIRRARLDTKFLETIFSVGGDEIELIADTKMIPGSSKRARMREVALLKAIAGYLSTGVARVEFKALKEACEHYKAFDAGNFAAHIKQYSREFSGSKEGGYILTATGLSNAATLIGEMKASAK